MNRLEFWELFFREPFAKQLAAVSVQLLRSQALRPHAPMNEEWCYRFANAEPIAWML